MSDFEEAILKVANKVNSQRRKELRDVYTNRSEFKEFLRKHKQYYEHPKGGAHWRLHASFPVVVDDFFSNMYGQDYYKDPDFFKKHYPEWLAIDEKDI